MHSILRFRFLSVAYVAAMILFGSQSVFAQELGSPKTFPPIPERPTVSIPVAQKAAGIQFQHQNEGWTIRWRERSQTPRSVLGPPLKGGRGTPLQIARQFLSDNISLFGMQADLSNLEPIRVEERRFNHVLFQQVHKGIPVEGSVYSVHMTKDGSIYYASGDYFSDVQLERSSPSLSEAQAIGIATSDLGARPEVSDIPESKLIILPYGAAYRLAWKVTVSARSPSGRWVYYVSADDGSILGGYNDSDAATADGDVYDHHPSAGSIVSRTLTHLDGAGYSLSGSYVQVENEDASEAYETDGTFEYSDTNTHFDEVMVYYHATEFQKYLGSEVGYAYLNYPGTLVKVEAEVHVGTNSNATQAIAPYTLEFTDGDGSTYRDFAKESDVIAHEYEHLVTEYITYDGLDDGALHYNEEDAMDEAFSDYFGGSYAGSPDIGEHVYIPSGPLRDLENGFTYSDWDGAGGDSFSSTNYHGASQIFSGALWDLRQEFGENDGNVLVFEGLDNLDQSNPEFLDGRDAIVAAANALSYSGSDICTIREIFDDREIGSECVSPPAAPTNLDVSGDFGEHPYLTWNASTGANEYYIYRCLSATYYCTTSYSFIDYTFSTNYTDTSREVEDNCGFTFYRVTAVNLGGESSPSSSVTTCTEASKGGPPDVPTDYALYSNYPNPFNPMTDIAFALPEATHVRLVVYDALGREVERLLDGPMEAGFQRVTWDATNLPTGVYIYRLEAGDFSASGRMVLMK